MRRNHYRALLLAAAFAPLLAAPAHASFLWFRGKINSHWTTEGVRIAEEDPQWRDVDPKEDSGIDFRALNDDKNLYLRFAADDDTGRVLLTGTYRQDISVWFMGPDLKTRAWGILIPFSSLAVPKKLNFTKPAPKHRSTKKGDSSNPLAADETTIPDGTAPHREREEESQDDEGHDIDVYLVSADGTQISSSPLGGFGVDFRTFGDHRHPVFQLIIPLEKLNQPSGKAIPMDFVSSNVSPGVEDAFNAQRIEASKQAQAAADRMAAGGIPSGGGSAPSVGAGSIGSLAASNLPSANGAPGANLPAPAAQDNNAVSQAANAYDDFQIPYGETVRMSIRLSPPPEPGK